MQPLPQEDWYELRIMGIKVGYSHIHIALAEYEGQATIRVRSEMQMSLKRSGQGIEIKKTKDVYMNEAFQPVYFVTVSNESGAEKRVEGWVQDSDLVTRTSLSGDVSEQRKPIPEGAIFEDSLGLLVRERGLDVGKTYKLSVLNLELFQAIQTTVTIEREDTLAFEGQQQPVVLVNYDMQLMMGGINSTEWIGRDGTTYKMQMNLAGIGMEMLRTDRDNALGAFGEVDVILEYRILPKGPAPIRGSLFRAKVVIPEGDVRKAIMETSEQTVSADTQDPRKGVLEIRRAPVDSDIAVTPEDLDEYLKPTVYVQADDPAIRQKAQEIVDGTEGRWEATQKICYWVYNSITDKTLKVGFGSAKQTLESLEGDCTEHTVLFAALARASGIPTRIVAGLVFQGEAFYYHFWPEVHVGRWVQVEPTLGQAQADATHIQLAGGHLESESVLEFGEGVLRTLNQLQIETLESW